MNPSNSKKIADKKTKIPNLFEKGQGLKTLIGFSACLILSLIMVWNSFFARLPVKKGQISGRNIVAEYDFGYINGQKTDALKRDAKNLVPPVCVENNSVLNKSLQKVLNFFRIFNEISLEKENSFEEKTSKLKGRDVFSLSEEDIGALLRKDNPASLGENLSKAIIDIYNVGVISMSDRLKIEKINDSGKIRIKSGKDFIDIDVVLVYVSETLVTHLGEIVKKYFSDEKRIKDAVVKILAGSVTPNLSYNKLLTLEEREKAVSAVQPAAVEMDKGALLVRKGEIVTKHHVEMLKSYYGRGKAKDFLKGRYIKIIGSILITVILIFASAMYLKHFQPEIFKSNKILFMIEILLVTAVFFYKMIVFFGLSVFLLPVAVVSITLAMLVNSRIALFTTMVMSLLMAIIAEYNMSIAITGIVGGMVAIHVSAGVRYRSRLIRAGFFTGIAYFLSIFAVESLSGGAPQEIFISVAMGFVSGLASPFIVMGILPFLETGFNLTTDIHLLEMADLNHPLLKKMMLEAPGTYHHSLVVGNLSEAAADAIGAKSLIGKVGSYFHDIGKIVKAEYFSENEDESTSRHDKLIPSMSHLIITNHVKDGFEMAVQYKLNKTICDIIQQHHGTGLVYFFYKRAQDESSIKEDVKEESFRYPGPKPQTREAAVVLLADAIEAASRTLEKPTPARIRNFVDEIVDEKMIDGQLNECPLTMQEIGKIKEAFIMVLNGMFHTRVKYPKNEGRDKKSSNGEN
ncbi:MAG: HDIG domain-containing protein [Candidatus Aureabacteria bacterium]|nr:HDIG domain-containing protein [Candidatus Auribacterota bacterium]